MFSTTIIPTVGRVTLPRAVNSVLSQPFDKADFEVIVVNDTGGPLHGQDWQTSNRVQVITTNRRERSVARNAGAAIARGKYLHFLDDDDWMLPHAFQAFWEATRNSSAAWFHGAFRMVDSSGEKIIDVFPEEIGNCFINLISWEWLPLQASVVDAKAFFNVGGFTMLDSLKGGFEDIHLTRQIANQYDFMNVPRLVACVRSGDDGSTTNYMDMFIQNSLSREKSLSVAGSYQRLISSARNNRKHKEYWHGKVVYYLLGSAVKNLRARQFLTAISRAFYALAGRLASGRYFFRAEFWQGLTKFHYPRVWLYQSATQGPGGHGLGQTVLRYMGTRAII